MRPGHLGRTPTVALSEPEADLASSFHALLASDDELARRTHEELLQAHHDHALLMQGRPMCSVLRPRFISARKTDQLARVSAVLAGVFERAGSSLLASDRLLDLLGASDAERSIWQVDPGYPGFTVTSRLDSFMVGMEPRFVEYNAESPAGIGFCDRLTDIFLGLPAMTQWATPLPLERFDARSCLLEALLWAYGTWGGRGTPTVAVVDWEDVLTRTDFELCAEYFRESGVPAAVTDPRRLEYRGGRLWLGDQRIDLVYRRVLLHELLDKAEEARALLQAYQDGAVCMVNSPRSKVLHKKSLFALLHEGSLPIELSPEEQGIVSATVPWTRLVVAGQTTYAGSSVDLVRFVLAERERLALKPVDDYGGRGVVLGWVTSPEEWERAVERALGSGYVVQERVEVPAFEFPAWQNGRVVTMPLMIDTDPLLFRGRLGGVLTRMSGSALLNVSAGTGSTVPTFQVMEG